MEYNHSSIKPLIRTLHSVIYFHQLQSHKQENLSSKSDKYKHSQEQLLSQQSISCQHKKKSFNNQQELYYNDQKFIVVKNTVDRKHQNFQSLTQVFRSFKYQIVQKLLQFQSQISSDIFKIKKGQESQQNKQKQEKEANQNESIIQESQILLYIHNILLIQNIEQSNLNKMLIWIYSLLTSSCKSSLILQIKNSIKQVIIKLALSLIWGIGFESSSELNIEQVLQRATQEDLQTAINHYLIMKNNKKSNTYQICRICQNHIYLPSMNTHLTICQKIHQSRFLHQKIESLSQQFLLYFNQNIQFTDQNKNEKSRKVTHTVYEKVYMTLGKKGIFILKDKQKQILQTIQMIQKEVDQKSQQQFSLILQLKNLLKKYQQVSFGNIFKDEQGNKLIKNQLKRLSLSIKRKMSDYNTSKSDFSSDSSKTIFLSSNNISLEESQSKIGHTFDDFKILKFIGKGSYCQVYLAQNKQTKDYCAMKIVKTDNIDQSVIQSLNKQKQIYLKINSHYTVQLYQTFNEKNLHFLLLEYENGGSLQDLLNKQVYLSQQDAKLYIAQIIQAVYYLHSIGIIHRDLKPANMMIHHDGHLKLTDFNLAQTLHRVRKINQQINQDKIQIFGTPDYIAPQVINGISFNNPQCDWWAVGVIIYQLLIGVTPFSDQTFQAVFQHIVNYQIEWPPISQPNKLVNEGEISYQAYELIKKFLQPNIKQRFSDQKINQIKSHPFFKGFDWQNLNSKTPFFVPSPSIYPQNQQLKAKQQINNLLLNRDKNSIHNQKSAQEFKQKQKKSKNQNNSSRQNFKSKQSIKSDSKQGQKEKTLSNIVRYDILKKSTLKKANKVMHSRFKQQKDIRNLQVLTIKQSKRKNIHLKFDKQQEKQIMKFRQNSFNHS